MFTIPPFNYLNRLLIIVAGITLLIWSGLEDNQVGGVVVLGWILAVFVIVLFIQSRFGGKSISTTVLLRISPLLGATIGASASLITVMLMIFKDIRHGHVFPDYPPQLMLAILERLPIWAISGGLIAFGIAIIIHRIFADKGDTSPTDSVTM